MTLPVTVVSLALISLLSLMSVHGEPVIFKQEINAAAPAESRRLQRSDGLIQRSFVFPAAENAAFPAAPAALVATSREHVAAKPARNPKILLNEASDLAANNQLSAPAGPAHQPIPRAPEETKILALAMEHLVERLSSMEQRLGSLESTVSQMQDASRAASFSAAQHSVQQPAQQQLVARTSCPANFISLPNAPADSPCYFFSSASSNRRHNWQDAAQSCQRLGAKLAEPHSSEELLRIEAYMLTLTDFVGSNYWTGGINPGLLWIWSVAAKPLQNMDSSLWLESTHSDPATVDDNGKCLRIAYDRSARRYGLQGSDCQRYLYYVCQYPGTEAIPHSTAGPEVVTSNFHAVMGFRLSNDGTESAGIP